MGFQELWSRLKGSPDIQRPVGDVSIQGVRDDNTIFKSYIPGYLYKPPYGYPRREDLVLIRNLAKNPYIYSIIKSLQDEVASTEFDIVLKDGAEMTPQLEKIKAEILKFVDNPNNNKESIQQIMRAWVKDICEVDAGVIVKSFNHYGSMTQIFCRDGASFLKNPDVYGYIGNREDYVPPMDQDMQKASLQDKDAPIIKRYEANFKEQAAYFQYGFTGNALPVPFGKRELIYTMANPRSDSIYGLSPIERLADVIHTLVYGGNYNLDFYMNNNMPEGILSLIGASDATIKAMRKKMDSRITTKQTITGFLRKIGFKIPMVNSEVKFTPWQLDPKIMQIIEQQDWFYKLALACFGMNADDMGMTDKSNKAVSEVQDKKTKRKAIRPMLMLWKYHFDKEIIPEWGEEAFDNLEWKWEDYDLDEDLKKHDLYQKQVNIGIKTSEMIAEEEGIDVNELKIQKAEKEAKELELAQANSRAFPQGPIKPPEPKQKAHAGPHIEADTELEKEMIDQFKENGEKLLKALEGYENPPLNQIE